MSTPIQTNKIIITLDHASFINTYSIFLVTTSEKYFKHGAKIIDAPLLCNAVKSVYYESGKSFYILMNRSDRNLVTLKKVVSTVEGGECVSISTPSVADVNERIITQLLLNALGTYNLDFLRFNNLTGHLYCFHTKWIHKSKNGKKQTIMKIPCVEISLTSDMHITLNVRTFSSVLLRKSITFGKRKFHEYPQYVIGAGNSLRRKLDGDGGNSFILRQTDGDKTTIPFLDIQSKHRFDISKMGVLTAIIGEFNKKYDSLCNINFMSISNYQSVDCTRARISENKAVIEKMLSECHVRVIDKIGDEYSDRFCKEIKDALEENYSVKAMIGKQYLKDALNISVIHNATYYTDVNDPHMIQKDKTVVQHITLEDFQGGSKFALSTVISEILIKRDIINRKISLFDWKSIALTDSISFGMQARIQDVDRYFFMEIHPDGSFDFQEQTLNLFEINQYSDCVTIFEDSDDVCGIIKAPNGDINIIRKTGWFTIPDINTINRLLTDEDTHLRGKTRRDELLSSVLDIKQFTETEGTNYFVGTIGEGMRTKINWASNIRKIEPYKNAPLMFDNLLRLMNVTFIHNGQLTVVPFPFKYLREYIIDISNEGR